MGGTRDGRRRVWRRDGERCHPAEVVYRYGTGSVMVWAGLTISGRTDL